MIEIFAQHIYKFNHEFDWDNTQILDFETNYNKRLISEMIHIKEQKSKSERYIFIRT